jgi:hypothetical protein
MKINLLRLVMLSFTLCFCSITVLIIYSIISIMQEGW